MGGGQTGQEGPMSKLREAWECLVWLIDSAFTLMGSLVYALVPAGLFCLFCLLAFWLWSNNR